LTQYLPAHFPYCRLNLPLVHYGSLRPALVGLVAQFFGFFDRVKDRQLAFLEPAFSGVRESNIVGTVTLRFGLADELDFEAMIAINATQKQSAAGTSRKQFESPPRGSRLGYGNAVGIGAFRTEPLRAFVPGGCFLTRSSLSFPPIQQKLQEGHAHWDTVSRLLEIDTAPILIHL